MDGAPSLMRRTRDPSGWALPGRCPCGRIALRGNSHGAHPEGSRVWRCCVGDLSGRSSRRMDYGRRARVPTGFRITLRV